MIYWIIAITIVAVYGPAWVAAVMCVVAVGGPPVARLLARRLKLPGGD